MKEYHLIEPIYDKDSKILILGSFPSVKSREANFFYHHPQGLLRNYQRFSGFFQSYFDNSDGLRLKTQTVFYFFDFYIFFIGIIPYSHLPFFPFSRYTIEL